MKKRAVVPAAVMLILASMLTSGDALAREPLGFNGWGPRVGYQFDDAYDQFYFGAHFRLGEFVENLEFLPSIDMGFGDNTTLLSVNPDIVYHFPVEGVGSFYVGGIFAFQYLKFDSNVPGVDDTDTELGIHATAGLDFGDTPVLIETMLGIDDTPDVKICVGYTFEH